MKRGSIDKELPTHGCLRPVAATPVCLLQPLIKSYTSYYISRKQIDKVQNKESCR